MTSTRLAPGAVDRPSARAATELVVCAVIAMLVLADASVRFPAVVSSVVPSASMALAEVALGLAIAAVVAPLFAPAYRVVERGVAGAGVDVGAVVQRSAKRWRRLIDTAF